MSDDRYHQIVRNVHRAHAWLLFFGLLALADLVLFGVILLKRSI